MTCVWEREKKERNFLFGSSFFCAKHGFFTRVAIVQKSKVTVSLRSPYTVAVRQIKFLQVSSFLRDWNNELPSFDVMCDKKKKSVLYFCTRMCEHNRKPGFSLEICTAHNFLFIDLEAKVQVAPDRSKATSSSFSLFWKYAGEIAFGRGTGVY